MNKERNFKVILEKYEKGIATKEEIRMVETFFREMQQGGLRAQHIKTDLALNNRIFSNIEKKTHKKKISYGWAVAAAVTLLIAVSLFKLNGILKPDLVEIYAGTGMHKEVWLSDSTKVVLNAGSTLKYPEHFNGSQREVSLTGEAFFEVTHNAEKPFIVLLDGVQTKVLGTTFNVQAYADEPSVEVTLITGKVLVSKTGNKDSVILTPSMQGIFDKKEQHLVSKTVSTGNILAWKNNLFSFENEPLPDVLRSLSRYYHVSFNYKEIDIQNVQISGEFKNDDLQNILQGLTFLTGLHFEHKNEQVTITNPGNS